MAKWKNEPLEVRRTGRTTQAMKNARPGRVLYVGLSRAHTSCHQTIAKELGREDIQCIPSQYLRHPERYYGLDITDIVVDHSIELDKTEKIGLAALLRQIR